MPLLKEQVYPEMHYTVIMDAQGKQTELQVHKKFSLD